jgi:hypothetical protein
MWPLGGLNQRELTHDEGRGRDLSSNVAELRHKAEHGVLALPQRALVAEAGGFLLLLDGRLGDLRELGEAEQNDESESEAGNAEVDVSAGEPGRQQCREGCRKRGVQMGGIVTYWTAPREFSFLDPKKVWEAIWGPTKVARPLNCGRRCDQRLWTGHRLPDTSTEDRDVPTGPS